MFHSNKSKLQTRTDFAVLRVRELFQIPLRPPPYLVFSTIPSFMMGFFYAAILPNEWQGFTPILPPNREHS